MDPSQQTDGPSLNLDSHAVEWPSDKANKLLALPLSEETHQDLQSVRTATMNTTTDESPRQDTTFKDQLDKAAVEQREREQPRKPNPVFIPAASKVLGPKKPAKEEPPSVSGPPERPDHDPSIETFVRDQHRSKQPGSDADSVDGE
ncbi:hypothetical protein E4U53_005352 [Claviceps sorghi]|nr:hypothetical protein E4U53_005352 [Claviceps sorghi]